MRQEIRGSMSKKHGLRTSANRLDPQCLIEQMIRRLAPRPRIKASTYSHPELGERGPLPIALNNQYHWFISTVAGCFPRKRELEAGHASIAWKFCRWITGQYANHGKPC
jgi:hypothetical protein